MNTRAFALVTSILLVASGCATDDTSAARPAVPATSLAAAPGGSKKEDAIPVLTAGISADEVIKLVGKPLEVIPKPAPQGKAEVWNYRRLVDTQTKQVATSVASVDAYNPVPGGSPNQSPEIRFTTVVVKTFQVTSLLMFNDKLVTAKQWQEQKQDYEN